MQVEVYVVRVVYFPSSYSKTKQERPALQEASMGVSMTFLPWDLSGETGKKVCFREHLVGSVDWRCWGSE